MRHRRAFIAVVVVSGLVLVIRYIISRVRLYDEFRFREDINRIYEAVAQDLVRGGGTLTDDGHLILKGENYGLILKGKPEASVKLVPFIREVEKARAIGARS